MDNLTQLYDSTALSQIPTGWTSPQANYKDLIQNFHHWEYCFLTQQKTWNRSKINKTLKIDIMDLSRYLTFPLVFTQCICNYINHSTTEKSISYENYINFTSLLLSTELEDKIKFTFDFFNFNYNCYIYYKDVRMLLEYIYIFDLCTDINLIVKAVEEWFGDKEMLSFERFRHKIIHKTSDIIYWLLLVFYNHKRYNYDILNFIENTNNTNTFLFATLKDSTQIEKTLYFDIKDGKDKVRLKPTTKIKSFLLNNYDIDLGKMLSLQGLWGSFAGNSYNYSFMSAMSGKYDDNEEGDNINDNDLWEWNDFEKDFVFVRDKLLQGCIDIDPNTKDNQENKYAELYCPQDCILKSGKFVSLNASKNIPMNSYNSKDNTTWSMNNDQENTNNTNINLFFSNRAIPMLSQWGLQQNDETNNNVSNTWLWNKKSSRFIPNLIITRNVTPTTSIKIVSNNNVPFTGITSPVGNHSTKMKISPWLGYDKNIGNCCSMNNFTEISMNSMKEIVDNSSILFLKKKNSWKQYHYSLFGDYWIWYNYISEKIIIKFFIPLKNTFIVSHSEKEKIENTTYHWIKIFNTTFGNKNDLSLCFYFQNWINQIDLIKTITLKTGYKDLSKIYTSIKPIGNGAFGSIRLMKDKATNKSYALKKISLCTNNKIEYTSAFIEKDIATFLIKYKTVYKDNLDPAFSHIIEFFDVIETSEHLYFIMEYVQTGSLRDYIRKCDKLLSPNDILGWAKQIFKGLAFIQSYGIWHRDIKLENIWIDKDNHAKIIDFGLGKVMTPFATTNEPFGTIVYTAPEIWTNCKYNFTVDNWSVGVILYYLYFGEIPFNIKGNETRAQTSEKIVNNQWIWKIDQESKRQKNYKYTIINVIAACLLKNGNQRLSSEELSRMINL